MEETRDTQHGPGETPAPALPDQLGRSEITVYLQNPEGILKIEEPFLYNDPRALTIGHRQVLVKALRDGGFWREISDTEHEFIPASSPRIKSINIALFQQLIAQPTPGQVAAVKRGPQLIKP